ncbi:MAG: DEAD/DEAH box helicase, partial [bacterium]|nr:DEAD/DEAH box helicase [bacterium]
IYSRNQGVSSLNETLARKYEQSLWSNLARIGFEYYHEDGLIWTSKKNDDGEFVLYAGDQNGNDILEFVVPQLFLTRLIQKYRWKFFKQFQEQELPAEAISDSLSIPKYEKTYLEIRMNESGFKSWLQKFEESYWYDFSKAWFLDFGDDRIDVSYLPDTQTMTLEIEEKKIKYRILRQQVPRILQKLAQNEQCKRSLNIHDEVVKLNYSLEITDEHELKVTPVLEFPDAEQPLLLSPEAIEKPVLLGKYVYLTQAGFYPFERKVDYYDSSIFKMEEVRIPNDRIFNVVIEYKKHIDHGDFYYVSPSLQHKSSNQDVKMVDVFIDDVEDDWLYLSIKYRIGDETISFLEIYRALKSGKRFLIGKNSWIDLHDVNFKWLFSLFNDQDWQLNFSNKNSAPNFKIRKMSFIKLNAHLALKKKVNSRHSIEHIVEKLTQFKPSSKIPALNRRNYQLRDYQKNGLEWLWFLYENHLSGLLCDDMGLGKTFQSLALIDAAIRNQQRQMRFLVVCPTSVLPHWYDKLQQLGKRVKILLYYGGDRSLDPISDRRYLIILTSYGILRNDLDKLAPHEFELAIFDEIQTAKNKASLTNAALNQLNCRVRLGLTGTPIENSLSELKALFDIVLPDYLGGDFSFRKQYIVPIERHQNKNKREELRKIIQPFVLRRTKQQVLQELPPKIEDIRKCSLSEDQVGLYQKVIEERAKTLVAQLYNQNNEVPYIHIFAVLSLLKQICNHPAQLEDSELDYRKYQSGKWDLFCELLEESLNSGFKVVVFSQYLNMLALIEQYLDDNQIQFATIKGSTINRKQMIDRFNNDPECRVFSGSLRASGQGIDLIGGSVVIHYDRWWNAAVEDQATDRVHRIGQIRGVQVFKLVTEGTLEEKIDRLIYKKKKLMDDLMQPNDVKSVKHFSREELIEMLTFNPSKIGV